MAFTVSTAGVERRARSKAQRNVSHETGRAAFAHGRLDHETLVTIPGSGRVHGRRHRTEFFKPHGTLRRRCGRRFQTSRGHQPTSDDVRPTRRHGFNLLSAADRSDLCAQMRKRIRGLWPQWRGTKGSSSRNCLVIDSGTDESWLPTKDRSRPPRSQTPRCPGHEAVGRSAGFVDRHDHLVLAAGVGPTDRSPLGDVGARSRWRLCTYGSLTRGLAS
jgi:hypothetical protein